MSADNQSGADERANEPMNPDGYVWKDAHHYEHVGYGPMPMHQQASARPFVFVSTLAALQAQPSAPANPNAMPERDTSIPAEAQGLFRKFDVRRVDGSDQIGGKHHGCEYFVLDVDHDQHAPAALLAYAHACKDTHPHLSADLIARYATPADMPASDAAKLDEFIDPSKLHENRMPRFKHLAWLHAPMVYAKSIDHRPDGVTIVHECGHSDEYSQNFTYSMNDRRKCDQCGSRLVKWSEM